MPSAGEEGEPALEYNVSEGGLNESCTQVGASGSAGAVGGEPAGGGDTSSAQAVMLATILGDIRRASSEFQSTREAAVEEMRSRSWAAAAANADAILGVRADLLEHEKVVLGVEERQSEAVDTLGDKISHLELHWDEVGEQLEELRVDVLRAEERNRAHRDGGADHGQLGSCLSGVATKLDKVELEVRQLVTGCNDEPLAEVLEAQRRAVVDAEVSAENVTARFEACDQLLETLMAQVPALHDGMLRFEKRDSVAGRAVAMLQEQVNRIGGDVRALNARVAKSQCRVEEVDGALAGVVQSAAQVQTSVLEMGRQMRNMQVMMSEAPVLDVSSAERERILSLELALRERGEALHRLESRVKLLESTEITAGARAELAVGPTRRAQLYEHMEAFVASARGASSFCLQFMLMLVCVVMVVHAPLLFGGLTSEQRASGVASLHQGDTSAVGDSGTMVGMVAMMASLPAKHLVTRDMQTAARVNIARGSVPRMMLSDSGASHYIDLDDFGCIEGSWAPDIPGLHLGDNTLIPAYGSCEKAYIDPKGGDDLVRRVLICPDVSARVWSQGREVDMHESTYVDAPSGAYYELADGRRMLVSKSKNALRWVDWKVRPTAHSTAVQLVAGSGRCMWMSSITNSAGITTVVGMNASERSATIMSHTTGVGKRAMQLTPIEYLRLWHARLGHASCRRVLATLKHHLVLDAVVVITREAYREFSIEHCDVCDAFRQKREGAPHAAPRAAVAPVVSPRRALRPLWRVLLDVWGKFKYPSAQHHYVFYLGYTCEATGMRWLFGSKEHTAEVQEEHTQRLRATLRRSHPTIEFEIIRTDGASEFAKAKRWAGYLADSTITHELSIAYQAWQMGAQERGWGLSTPPAKAMLASSPLSVAHHYTASRHATHLNNLLESTVTSFEARSERSSSYERFFRVKYRGDSLYCYGAPLRYVIDETLRDSKFDASAEAAYYVGVSPENASAIWAWTGTRHVTVGGSHKCDETRYLGRALAKHDKLPFWPNPDPADGAMPVPVPVRPVVQNTTVVLRAGYDPVPVGSILDVGYTQADGAMVKWRGTVTGNSPKAGGKQYTRFDWGDAAYNKEDSVTRGIDLTLPSHPFWVVHLAAPDADTALPTDVDGGAPAPAPAPVAPAITAPAAVAAAVQRRHTRSVPGVVSDGLRVMEAAGGRGMRKWLVLFAGPRCEDSVASALRELGAQDGDAAEEIDIMQGGLAHNLGKIPNQLEILRRIEEGEFAGIAMAPPCRSFAVILDPWRRTHEHIDGVPSLTEKERAAVQADTSLAAFCAVVALAADAKGVPWLIEQPAFRGDEMTMAHWKGCEDAPHMFQLREFQVLIRVARPVQVVFPQCALDAESQKFTVIMASRSLYNGLAVFRELKCTHTSHAEVLEGMGDDGQPRTRAAAHYPRRMARLVAKVLHNSTTWDTSVVATRREARVEDVACAGGDDVSTEHGSSVSPMMLNITDPTHVQGGSDAQHRDQLSARSRDVTPSGRQTMSHARSPASAGGTVAPEVATPSVQWTDARSVPSDSSVAGLNERARLALMAAAGKSKRLTGLLLQAAEYLDVPLHVFADPEAPKPRAQVNVSDVSLEEDGQTFASAPWLVELREAEEVYVFDFEMADHPALLAAKAKGARIAPKTVVYFGPDGVAKVIEPRNLAEALASLQAPMWRTAIESEISNLETHNAYQWVDRSTVGSRRIFRTTWVFKVKTLEGRAGDTLRIDAPEVTARLDKFKARCAIVTSGAVQGVDYGESFMTGAQHTSVKMVCGLVAAADWEDLHWDVQGAFLEAEIDQDTFVEPPKYKPVPIGADGRPMVWKLIKAIYGTRQAGRLFTRKFQAVLREVGFEQCIEDPAVFRLDHKLGKVIMATHVDDLIGGGSTKAVLEYARAAIEARGFQFGVVGGWDTALGFGVTRDRATRSVTFTATNHIMALVNEHLVNDSVESKPIVPTGRDIMSLSPAGAETAEEEASAAGWRSQCRSLLGSLIYISVAHPAICHATSRCCAHMSKPTLEVYRAAKCILSWLRKRSNLGVTYGRAGVQGWEDLLLPRSQSGKAIPSQPMSGPAPLYLSCASDSDLNRRVMQPGEPAPREASRSQLGYIITFMGGALDGASRRQHSTAVDTPAAELFAASVAASKLVSVRGALRFASFGTLGHEPTPLWCDNEACLLVSQDATSIKRLAYIARRCKFMQELHEEEEILLGHVPGTRNPADMMTKYMEPKALFVEYAAWMYNCTVEQMR